MSDMVYVGYPEGVRWDVGMGKGWDTLGCGLGVAGLQKLQGECGGPSVRLRICRGATFPRPPPQHSSSGCPALPQDPSDIRHFLPFRDSDLSWAEFPGLGELQPRTSPMRPLPYWS